MNILMQGGAWLTVQPSAVFEPSGLNTEALMLGLDRKLKRVAARRGEIGAGRRFRQWLQHAGPDLEALVFQVPEIISKDAIPPNMFAVAKTGNIGVVSKSLSRGLPALSASPVDFPMLDTMSVSMEGPSPARAFLSGELLAWVRRPDNAGAFRLFLETVQALFDDGKVLGDLSMLLAMDVARKLSSRDGELVRMEEEEFERIAKAAMRRRRVESRDPVLRGKLMGSVRERLECAPSARRKEKLCPMA